MNCREFEDIVNDLARGKMIDAASRTAGLAHAGACERCASRLADDRSLSAGLKSLAASDEGLAAPDRVEVALLAAFRAQSPNQVARHVPVRARIRPRWVLAAAAVILIALGFVAYRAVQNEPLKDDEVVKENPPAPQPSPNLGAQVVKHNPEPGAPRRSRATQSRRDNRRQLNKPFIRESITLYARDNEYTTDFFPLSYSDEQEPGERDEVIRVQVIRVQMPRSAFIAFGLPVNIERADAPVKADLMVGEDGLARAIRFVR